MFKLRLLFFFLLFLSLSCQKDDPKTFYTLNVRVSPPGSGNVNPTSATFEAGQIATILASPNNRQLRSAYLLANRTSVNIDCWLQKYQHTR